MYRTAYLIAFALLTGCEQKPVDSGPVPNPVIDADSDGYALEADCDDANPEVNAGATEVCDGIDNNCDERTDEDIPTSTWYYDADGDGFGVEGTAVEDCRQPAGYADAHGDCDDANSDFHPGAAETDCTDPNDYNCDGSSGAVDDDEDGFYACEECDDANPAANPAQVELCNDFDDNCDSVIDTDATDALTWYQDADADGYGDDATAIVTCDPPKGWVTESGDCNDGNGAYHPGATESCTEPNDYNCDGSVGYADLDGDGSAACDDCDDSDATSYPGGTEVCDGADNDCDGTPDDDATDAATFYVDGDGDGYGDPARGSPACEAPMGSVATGDDCDDADAEYHPGATESCDEPRDLDCDGTVAYVDADFDGVAACLDCDDTDPTSAPGMVEVCDAADNDCDGDTDEADAVGAGTWYADVDADGYGDPDSSVRACTQPAGTVADATDCDPADGAVNPGAAEVCDEVDNDCDGRVDLAAVDAPEWYTDDDGDGFGDPDLGVASCDAPVGTVDNGADCDDGDAAVNPDAIEYCGGGDEDCSGAVDDGAADATTWYTDTDADTYGLSSSTLAACTLPSGYSDREGDCDDTRDDVNPDAAERCDGADNDCDTEVDESSAIDAPTWYGDEDGDGYGTPADTTVACAAPSGYAAESTDCDDTEPLANPGQEEVCDDTVDNDCDGTDNGCSPSGALVASGSDWVLRGDGSTDFLGSAMAGGDVDADGLADVLVGAYGWDPTSSGARADGRAYLHFSPYTGSETTGGADATFSATQPNAGFGQSLAILGDTDGDGNGDYAIAAYRYDVTTTSTLTDAGATFVYTSGPTGSVDDGDADTVVGGVSANDWAGCAVTGAGDVNDDGYADMLISANQVDVGSVADGGAIGLHYGPFPTGAVALDAGETYFTGTENNQNLGVSMASGGDYDGDGYADVGLGAHLSDSNGTDAGTVYLFLGPAPAGVVSVSTADVILTGDAAGDQFGRSLGFADTNGDGSDDLVVGADFADQGAATNAGAAYLFSTGSGSGAAASATARFAGVTTDDFVGRSLANAGDVDGDGTEDLLLSATGFDNGATSGVGGTYLLYASFSGTTTLSSYGARIRGSTTADAVGYTVAGDFDLDADGFADFATTSVAADSGVFSSNGAAFLTFGGGY